jgi:chromosomal replication initiator protein
MHNTVTDEAATAQAQVASIVQALAERIGPEKHRLWFGETSNVALADGSLRITVPNTFTANWIETHYLEQIRTVAEAVLGHCPKVTFSVKPQSQHKGPKAAVRPLLPAAQEARPSTDKIQSQARVTLTLESFIVGPCNELAFTAAKTVVGEGPSPFNPLFLHGGYGVGKTHLLQGICHEIARTRPQSSWLYLSAEEFANQFITSLKNKKLEEFRRRIRQLDLLAIDDIHFLANKPSTQEEFLHTFNTISLAGKQVVLASDAPPKMIKQLSEKLINRFVSGMVVRIGPPDLATRCRICEQYLAKVAKALPPGRAVLLPRHRLVGEDVIRYVEENVRANVRELEGALLKVMAYASIQDGPISLETARHALADHVEHHDTAIQVPQIEAAVASYFGVHAGDIHAARKDKTVSLARHFCMYLARKHTRLSFVELGQQLGNRHHATVIVACKKIEEMVGRDAELHWQGPSGNKVSRAKQVSADLEAAIGR